jgi:hypothetical protein
MRARQLGLEDFLGASLAASEEEALGTSTAFNSLPLRRCCTGDWPQCANLHGKRKTAGARCPTEAKRKQHDGAPAAPRHAGRS